MWVARFFVIFSSSDRFFNVDDDVGWEMLQYHADWD